MTKYTEELLRISKNFFSLRGAEYLETILKDPSKYSIFCLFKDYDDEKLFNLARNGMQNLSKENLTTKEKSDHEKFLALVLGAFQAKYDEVQNESNLF